MLRCIKVWSFSVIIRNSSLRKFAVYYTPLQNEIQSQLYHYYGSLQSLDWTGGLDWWTGLKIIFMLTNENSSVELHLQI